MNEINNEVQVIPGPVVETSPVSPQVPAEQVKFVQPDEDFAGTVQHI